MKIIARIKGGLGNQLFCYAAARRLSLVNNATLLIDSVTGFDRDYEYRRQYSLNHFSIPCCEATPAERLEPFSRYRRYLAKQIAKRQPFNQRFYIDQAGREFDGRLLALKQQKDIYLDGLWQSEMYFKDVEQTIREDLSITPPKDALNQQMALKICNCNAVALHVRWFDVPGNEELHNISSEYYRQALAVINEKIDSPHYFIFSDKPEATIKKLDLNLDRVTLVSHNKNDESAYADLWLMMQCKHFITANSTFSWWGAWLCTSQEKIVIHPKLIVREDSTTPSYITGNMPIGWVLL
jgi:hypothetical protein